MHRARRIQCKSWYNDEWRDRLLASMSFLAGEKPPIEIPVSSKERITVAIQPVTFSSGISYTVLPKFAKPPETEDEAREVWEEDEGEQADVFDEEADEREE